MAKLYFGFGISDSMFSGDLSLKRKDLGTDGGYADYLIRNPNAVWASETAICLNPSHAATIDAMNKRYGIHVALPEKAPVIKLESGDSLLVMSPRGLPRLMDRHEYTDAEIEAASFNFAVWTVE